MHKVLYTSVLFFSIVCAFAQQNISSAPFENSLQKININDSLETQKHGDSVGVMLPPCPGAAGTNNNYASATALTIGAAATAGSTNGATLEAGETYGKCTLGTPTQSVWYKFQATATTTYVIYTNTCASCNGNGVAIWPAGGLPGGGTISDCDLIACHTYGSVTTPQPVFQLTTVIGTWYYIQITWTSAGGCTQTDFTIQVANTTALTVTDPPPVNTFATAYPVCYFNIPGAPTAAQITAGCTGYATVITKFSGYSAYYSFTNTANTNKIDLQIYIPNNTCGGPLSGTVSYFNWYLYDGVTGALVGCGDINNLEFTLAGCGATYVVRYMWEVPNCQWNASWYPYIYVPASVGPCVSLPVELLSFTAECSVGVPSGQDAQVVAEWITASELNNNYFTLEKSLDGTDFYSVAIVNGAGSSNTINKYSAVDADPFKGISYYRLTQTDHNGQSETFSMVTVKGCGNDAVFVFSNENIITLLINSKEDNTYHIEMYNTLGQKITDRIANVSAGSNHIKLNPDNISSAIYVVKVFNSNNSVTKKVFIY